MDRFFGIVIAIAVVLGLIRLIADWFPKRAATAPVAAPAAAPPTLAAGDSLAERLHRIDEILYPFANTSAHPRDLAEKAEFREATALLASPDVSLERLMRYVHGANWVLASAALAALATRPDRQEALEAVLIQFEKLAAWSMQFALDYFLTLEPRPEAGAPFVATRDDWRDHPVIPSIVREHFDRRQELGDPPEFGVGLADQPAWRIQSLRGLLESLRHPFANQLIAALGTVRPAEEDAGYLGSVGRFWKDVDDGLLIEPEDWRAPLASAVEQLEGGTASSLLVMGEALVGKSTFLKLLAIRLAPKGWRVFEAGGTDLMAGQQWIGQLEERIRRTLDELAVGKKVVWYVPDLLQLARSGTNQTQSASLLDQILPAIASGRVIIWAEANPTIAARLFQARPLLRGVLEQVSIEARSQDGAAALTREVARLIAMRADIALAPESVPIAIDAARQYLSAGALPGTAIQLIKLAAKSAEEGGRRLGADELYAVLAQLTGLPTSILDARAPIDLKEVRAFFAARVIGQDEAVSAIAERIAMLKAGLNDPGKPIAVFLFAGPTGTGKTELAKTTAEYLFGSPDRMIRLDMSEFQLPESIGKLLGDSYLSADAETLVNRVRKQPFSVLLLDEFEKAHSRIWDLFLQVFDEGRLTDVSGQLADFRHCIIILTSNLGATTHQGSGLGFAPSAGTFSSEQVLRAVAQTYRPEFQNRLDQVIVFRPLTRELMRGILTKELNRVLERRGLKDRTWAVEFESTALEFLLEKGFSPEMGARPLKRAIDQHLLAPLAATIVERRFPEGDQFVFVRSDGRAIQAEFVDPDHDAAPTADPAPEEAAQGLSLTRMILSPAGTAEESAALAASLAGIERTLASPEWSEAKAALAERMAAPGFWQEEARFGTLAQFALFDRVAAAAGTARSLAQRLGRARGPAESVSRELVGRLALQLHLVEEGARDALGAAPVEIVLSVEPALEGSAPASAAALEWCRELSAMYGAWCERRHMQFDRIARGSREPPMLLVSGFGAHRTLSGETGLHVFEDGEGKGRLVARVVVADAPLGEIPKSRLGKRLGEVLAHAPRASEVVRRYRRAPSPLVRDARGAWRTGRLEAILAGDFDLICQLDGREAKERRTTR